MTVHEALVSRAERHAKAPAQTICSERGLGAVESLPHDIRHHLR